MVYWSRDAEPEEEKPRDPWDMYSRAPSAEVEMTSYALLAYTVGNQPEAVINGKPIVMWLSKQRNPQGGFSSTQVQLIPNYVKFWCVSYCVKAILPTSDGKS
jgi:alpha-2-macroglobulin